MSKLCVCCCFIISLLGCSIESDERSTFYITPVIEAGLLCLEAVEQESDFSSVNDAVNWCMENGYSGASLLSEKLDSLEPGGATGKVQIGYELGINLLSLYENKNGEWIIDDNKLDAYLSLIEQVDRPVVIYLMGNHFDTSGALSAELSQDKQNLMLLQNGQAPVDDYFGNSVIPFTLLTDESIPVNNYRFDSLRYISSKITELPEEAKKRIVGITLAGEIHHMYPDFTNGAGGNEDFLVTDYSPSSILGFQNWLETKYVSIDKFNEQFATNFIDFSEIDAPQKNVHKDQLNFYTEHYDKYAAGIMPISGWLWDENDIIEKLDLYVDGEKVGEVEQGLHRLDVYRQLEEVINPNVGFRYNLDYVNLLPGYHNAQVVATVNDQLYLIAQSQFVVVDRQQSSAVDDYNSNNKLQFADANQLGIRYWLDQPAPLTALYSNPLAKDWNEYREEQVSHFLYYFYDVAVESGLPEELLFSHQISSRINSSWEYQLFMEDKSVSEEVPYKLGINLYGGATNSKALTEFLIERNTSEYGVPEYHSQQWKSEDAAYDSLVFQYENGAKFISPYYITLVPDSMNSQGKHSLNNFLIHPDNSADGSNLLYDAIKKYAEQ